MHWFATQHMKNTLTLGRSYVNQPHFSIPNMCYWHIWPSGLRLGMGHSQLIPSQNSFCIDIINASNQKLPTTIIGGRWHRNWLVTTIKMSRLKHVWIFCEYLCLNVDQGPLPIGPVWPGTTETGLMHIAKAYSMQVADVATRCSFISFINLWIYLHKVICISVWGITSCEYANYFQLFCAARFGHRLQHEGGRGDVSPPNPEGGGGDNPLQYLAIF